MGNEHIQQLPLEVRQLHKFANVDQNDRSPHRIVLLHEPDGQPSDRQPSAFHSDEGDKVLILDELLRQLLYFFEGHLGLGKNLGSQILHNFRWFDVLVESQGNLVVFRKFHFLLSLFFLFLFLLLFFDDVRTLAPWDRLLGFGLVLQLLIHLS